MLVVWLLTGIWHGANFTFLLWGLWYFVLLSFEKLTDLPKRKLNVVTSVAYRIFTLLCVMLGWVLFRAEDLPHAWQYMCAMFGLQGNVLWDGNVVRYFNDYKLVLLAGIVCSVPLFAKMKDYIKKKFRAETLISLIYDLVLVGCMLLSISSLVMGVNNPFIYFNF